jgi:hypothetical protein
MEAFGDPAEAAFRITLLDRDQGGWASPSDRGRRPPHGAAALFFDRISGLRAFSYLFCR